MGRCFCFMHSAFFFFWLWFIRLSMIFLLGTFVYFLLLGIFTFCTIGLGSCVCYGLSSMLGGVLW